MPPRGAHAPTQSPRAVHGRYLDGLVLGPERRRLQGARHGVADLALAQELPHLLRALVDLLLLPRVLGLLVPVLVLVDRVDVDLAVLALVGHVHALGHGRHGAGFAKGGVSTPHPLQPQREG